VCYVGLGSNVGNRREHLAEAFLGLASLPETRLLRRSAVLETAPVGGVAQRPFLNAVAELRTILAPEALLDRLQRIEGERGRDRRREQRWGPRPLDLDLLLYGMMEVRLPRLVVPHPRLAERRFVLAPLAELAPDLLAPGLPWPIRDLLARLDASECRGGTAS